MNPDLYARKMVTNLGPHRAFKICTNYSDENIATNQGGRNPHRLFFLLCTNYSDENIATNQGGRNPHRLFFLQCANIIKKLCPEVLES